MPKSPFPGMDPYLEQSWRDVHHSLCTYSRDDLQEQLGGGLIARVDERLVVEIPAQSARALYPDVRIVERAGGDLHPSHSSSATAIAEPLTVEFDIESESHYEGFIEIIDPKGGTVITVIEFLSMSNKTSDREEYLRKQHELRLADVSLVEINLLRAGSNVTQVPVDRIPELSGVLYYTVVHRAGAGRKYQIYPMPLRDPLRKIKIPLRQSDPDAVLDLQSLIDRVYRNGAYHIEIDYSKPPTPPLGSQDTQWAAELIKSKSA